MIRFQIILPLKVGVNCFQNNQPLNQFTLNSSDYKIYLRLPLNMLNNNFNNSLKQIKLIKPAQILYQKDFIQLSQFYQQKSKSSQNTAIKLYFGQLNQDNQIKDLQIATQFDIFKLSIFLKEDKSSLKLNIIQRNLQLNFKQILKAKFVNNLKLKQIIKNQSTQQGVLSMDQAGRILIESQNCKFPVIGFWEKNDKAFGHFQSFSNIYKYLISKNHTKCKFIYKGQFYFYYAKFRSSDQTPQLYLVSWNEQQPKYIFYEQKLPKISSNNFLIKDQQIVIPQYQENLQSCMQFTLRHKQNQQISTSHYKKIGQSTKTSLKYCSPIKEIQTLDFLSKIQKNLTQNTNINDKSDCNSLNFNSNQNSNADSQSYYQKDSHQIQNSPQFKFNTISQEQKLRTPETPQNNPKLNQRFKQFSLQQYKMCDKDTLIKKIISKDNQIDYLKTQINRLRNTIKIISQSQQSSNKKINFLKSPYFQMRVSSSHSTAKIQKKKLSESDLNASLLSSIKFKSKLDQIGSQSPIQGAQSWRQRNKIYQEYQKDLDYLENFQIIQN